MTDRELLELAAKASGIEYGTKRSTPPTPALYLGPSGGWWNPLTDDGDALRLAVKLRINIEHCRTMGGKFVELHAWPVGRGDCAGVEAFEDDECAATRRAIVRAAAELGRNIP